MIRKTELIAEPFNFFEKHVFHGTNILRYSVQVNARHNVSAEKCQPCKNVAMESGWFDRLTKVIAEDDRSLNRLSEEAGLGRNYVQQMIKNGKQPTVDRLGKLLAVMPPHRAMFVLIGLELRAEDVEFLTLMRNLDPDARDDVRRFLSRFAESR